MREGTYVEYQTGHAEWGSGTVTKFDEQTQMLTVRDDDGSEWIGPVDLATTSDRCEEQRLT